jgi:hypothetical protein
MPRTAVVVASAGARSTRPSSGADTELNAQLTTLGRQIGYGRGLRPGRRQLLALVIVIVIFWAVVVFGRALGQLNDATQRQQIAADEARSVQLQLEAGRRELALVQTDAFQSIQARALGMGGNGELIFTLTSEGPPPVIVPLGQSVPAAPKAGPLETWLELLFGS